MILSVSRRTDIPNYYSDWFYNRIKEGFLYVRNPINAHQISKISLSPDLVDCIVFWTKNPENMLGRLDELKDYPFYFQFTLTGYGRDVEPGIPDKRRHMIDVFRLLSDKIGRDRVIWRYDPILTTDVYTREYHLKAFMEIARSLKGYTEKVIISFVDLYARTRRNTQKLQIYMLTEKDMIAVAEKMARIAKANQMSVESCAEPADLRKAGVKHGSCIDRELIEKMIGCRLTGSKDRNQREQCGCMESVEVGAYNTCRNGCSYCYANDSEGRVERNIRQYDVNSPLLCGRVEAEDVVTERKVKSLKTGQMSLFDQYD